MSDVRWGVKLRGERVKVSATDSWPRKKSAAALIANMEEEDALQARLVRLTRKPRPKVVAKSRITGNSASATEHNQLLAFVRDFIVRNGYPRRCRITIEQLASEELES